jgi:DNA-binding response OmpR family regulator
MTNEFSSPGEPPRPPGSAWRHRLSQLRHDLRNPLSEIVGFAELLIEEARERQLRTLMPGLDTIRQSANRILADLNHALNPDTVRLSPEVLKALNETVRRLSEDILGTSQHLSDQCDELGQATLGEDLLRISGSARRLREMAPVALEGLIGQGSVRDVPDDKASASPVEEGTPDANKIGPSGLAGAVLVVDDQEANRALLARRLRKQGYTVSLAENGRHALERLRARRFDLVLLDILMPEMDGVEVLRQVKADPELAHIPVLMLSALDELDAVVHCIELGAEDYLPKPFPAAILQARVQACLANKRMSDQLRKYTGWLFGKTLFSQAVAAPGSLNLTTQERTILFADIRGFSRWSECHAPEEAVTMLNRYFETAERIWTNSSVIKTEYTGDEIMGVFTSAHDAVRIAQALRIELGRLLDEVGLAIGVGLHLGPVIEGLMGGAEVKAYRFVGDTVNTAKRICSEAQPGQVLLSEAAFLHIAPDVVTGPAFELSAKGKAELLKVRPLLELVSTTG